MKMSGLFEKKIINNKKPIIMGILNVTPDSFSDGGEFLDAEKAIAHAKKMIADGADIIDIGAMSTRPGSVPVSADEEIRRLAPVLKALSASCEAVISVDTVNPETAEYALMNGVDIINDVSGFFNEKIAEAVKKYNAGWIITHTGGVASGEILDYEGGVVACVSAFFSEMLRQCDEFGIDKKQICFDPGFGFAKTTEDNIVLLQNLEKLIMPDVAFLTALSKKRFIGAVTDAPETKDRLAGTLAADLIAVMKGTDILRVHDVKETRQSLDIYNCIYNNI